MKKDFVFPILALSLICLVMTAALAVVNETTKPIIESAAIERQFAAMQDIIPSADAFIEMEIEPLPSTIVSAYRAINETGYIFIVRSGGFGGEMRIMSGWTMDGRFIASRVLQHIETVSFANRVFGIRDSYESQGQSLLEVDAISGATITFRAYQRALSDAKEALEIVRGQKYD